MSSETPVNAVYRERARLVAVLAALWPSVITFSDPNEPDWAVITIDSPQGQLTWHIHRDDLDVMGNMAWVARDDNRAKWDGHTTDEKYQRLSATLADLREADGHCHGCGNDDGPSWCAGVGRGYIGHAGA